MAALSLSAQSKQRQIVILAVGAVALGGLLLFQIPRTLERLNPPAASTSQATQTAPARSTAKRTAAQPARVVPRETTAPPRRLHLLSRFRSKDPFVQQVDANESAGSDGPTASAPAASAPASSAPASSAPASSAPASSAPPAPAAAETAKPARPTFTVESSGSDGFATLSVNGVKEKVRVAGTFPKESPVFRLVSLKESTAKIGIAGGTLKGGSQTVTLTKGEPLTLLNTVNGKRYKVELGAISRK